MSALWKMAVMEKKKDSTGLPVKSDHSDAGPFRDVPNPGNISDYFIFRKPRSSQATTGFPQEEASRPPVFKNF